MSKNRVFRFVILVLLLLFGSTCVVIWNGMKLNPPREQLLLQNFTKHRAAFEQLRDMLLVDTNLSRVAEWGVETYKPFFLGQPSEQNFPTNRYNKYLALLHEVGAFGASRGKGEYADPSIGMWGWGWAGDTRHIGICWLDREPTNQIPTLDNYRSHSENSAAYRHIDSNWYFWTDL